VALKKAVPLKPAQTLRQALLRDPRDIAADRIEAAPTAMVAKRTKDKNGPFFAVLTHQSVALAAITVASAVSISHDERTLIAMPIWHSSPLNNWFGATVYVGGTVVLLREYEPRRFLETVQAFQPARTAVVCQGRHRFAVVPCRIAGPITAVTHFLRGAIAP
jgi:hypothetical protein